MTEREMANRNTEGSPNIDPLSGERGAHPVGVGMGVVSAGAAGAAIGSMAGPIGTAVGAVVGAVAGGLAGKGMAEAIDPTVEDAYWRDNYSDRPYVTAGDSYDDLAPAYRHGWESRSRYQGSTFDDVETDLARDWSASPSASKLPWDKARHASRDAWERVDPTIEIQPRRSGR